MTKELIEMTLPLNEVGNVYMDLYNCSIAPDDFVSKFDGADMEADSLKTHPNATSGWVNQFESWRSEGIIS